METYETLRKDGGIIFSADAMKKSCGKKKT